MELHTADQEEEDEEGEEGLVDDDVRMTGCVDFMGTLIPGMDLPTMVDIQDEDVPPELPPKRYASRAGVNGKEEGSATGERLAGAAHGALDVVLSPPSVAGAGGPDTPNKRREHKTPPVSSEALLCSNIRHPR